jgi:AraC-like DNA-binding protein
MTTLPILLRDSLSAPPYEALFTSSWEGLARTSSYCRHRLARTFQISVRTLDRHFQKHFSMSVQQWVVELQLVDAYAQVLAGKPLKEISFDVGFKHRSHFTRSFKARFGIVPSLLKPSPVHLPRADHSADLFLRTLPREVVMTLCDGAKRPKQRGCSLI